MDGDCKFSQPDSLYGNYWSLKRKIKVLKLSCDLFVVWLDSMFTVSSQSSAVYILYFNDIRYSHRVVTISFVCFAGLTIYDGRCQIRKWSCLNAGLGGSAAAASFVAGHFHKPFFLIVILRCMRRKIVSLNWCDDVMVWEFMVVTGNMEQRAGKESEDSNDSFMVAALGKRTP